SHSFSGSNDPTQKIDPSAPAGIVAPVRLPDRSRSSRLYHLTSPIANHHAPVRRALEGSSMFMRWGMFIYRYRRLVAGLAIVIVVLAAPLASGVSAKLSSGGWLDPSSESAAVNDRLADQYG